MKKIFAVLALCATAVFAQAQDKATMKSDAQEELTEETSGNVLELRYIQVPVEHTEHSIMIDGERYELWPSKGRAEHIYKTQYLPKNLGKTIIYVRSEEEEKKPEVIRYDD